MVGVEKEAPSKPLPTMYYEKLLYQEKSSEQTDPISHKKKKGPILSTL